MAENTIAVTLPENLYHRLEILANKTERPIADVLAATVQATLSVTWDDKDLPQDVVDELAAMQQYSDENLWQAARSTFAPEQQQQFDTLTRVQEERTLTDDEQATLAYLLGVYDRNVIRRAQALALLALRGHQMPDLNITTPFSPAT